MIQLKIIIGLIIILFVYILFFNNNNNQSIVSYSSYDIEEIPDFLTSEECDTIIGLTEGKMFKSHVYSSNLDVFDTDTRKSMQCWLNDDNSLVKDITNRVKNLVQVKNPIKYEELQVVEYEAGGLFKEHYDACVGSKSYCGRMNEVYKGPRLATLMVYLNDSYKGGGTHFPLLNKTVIPKKGKAVLFYNIDENGDIIRESLHEGMPVLYGKKYICNKWIHL